MFKKCEPQLFDVNRKPSQPKRRRKITLVFDEKKRREFLGGFRKRKLERKRKAQEQLQQQLKEERKKIKQEARERYKKSLSHQIVPELEELLSRQEFDLGGHTVSVLELNVADLAEGKKWIGENKITEEKREKQDDKSDKSCNNDDDDDDDDDEIVGMSLQEKHKNPVQPKSKSDNHEVKSLKELKQEIKKAALNRIKKSKAFQQKQRLEQQKNKKQSRQKLQKAQELARKRGKKTKKKSRR